MHRRRVLLNQLHDLTVAARSAGLSRKLQLKPFETDAPHVVLLSPFETSSGAPQT